MEPQHEATFITRAGLPFNVDIGSFLPFESVASGRSKRDDIVEKPTGAADKHTDSCFVYALTQSSRTARRGDADDTRLHVAEEKYRKVRVENEAFKRRLGSHAGGLDAMR